MAYLIGIYLNYGFLDRGKGAENLQKKRRKQIKKLTNKEKEKRRIQGKSNNNKIHLWFCLLCKKLHFALKHSLKKVVYTTTIYLQFLCLAGYLRRSNNTRKLK